MVIPPLHFYKNIQFGKIKMNIVKIDCPCQTAVICEQMPIIQQLSDIRESCSALKEILIPDEIWKDYKLKVQEEYDRASHQYIILLAYKRGYLNNITYPIHKYLLDGNIVKDDLKNNYKSDLRERWMLGQDEQRRHVLCKRYQGKLTELRCAAWLQEQGWKIHLLEALCGENDIEATSPEDIYFAVEVKFIGFEDEKFLSSMREKGGSFDPAIDADYLLYIAYTAAKQLEKSNKTRLGIIVSSIQDWPFKDIALKNGYIDWGAPKFHDSNRPFINREEYPEIDNDLAEVLSRFNELWILREDSNYQYIKECIINFSPPISVQLRSEE